MKTNSYIKEDLEWLEAKLNSMKQYVDSNPIDSMRDRTIMLGTGKGAREAVTATVEQQIKSIKEVLKDLPAILEAVEKLREKSQIKDVLIKGSQEMPGMMKEKFQQT